MSVPGELRTWIVNHWAIEFNTPEARMWVSEFWYMKAEYAWQETRSPTGTAYAYNGMLNAVDKLIALGLFPERPRREMPTINEIEAAARLERNKHAIVRSCEGLPL